MTLTPREVSHDSAQRPSYVPLGAFETPGLIVMAIATRVAGSDAAARLCGTVVRYGHTRFPDDETPPIRRG